MGRGGGSGGRSSGGSFGGSRSSGGRSGGSFSPGRGGGSFGSGPSSGFSGGSGGSFFGGSGRPGRINYSGGGSPRSSGCGSFIAVLIIVVVIVVIILTSNSGPISNGAGGNNEITKSTIAREALPKGSANETGYFKDDLGWIGNQTQLLTGLKHFYQKTGVQPYLYITDTVNNSHSPTSGELDEFANKMYDQLFSDEAHMLLVFFEYNNSYMDRYVCGTQAKTVIDTEAADILLDYIDRYYYDSSLTEEAFFSKAFADAADRMMTVTRSPWIIVFVILGAIIILIILFIWWRHVKKQKNLEAKQTEEILNTPLETFGNKEIDELAKKYDDDDKNPN